MAVRIDNQVVVGKPRGILGGEGDWDTIKAFFEECDFESKFCAFLLTSMVQADFSLPIGMEIFERLREDVRAGLRASGDSRESVSDHIEKIQKLKKKGLLYPICAANDGLEKPVQGGECLWTLADMCRKFDVSIRTIRKWIRQGRLPHADIPASCHKDKGDTERWRPESVSGHIEKICEIKKKGLL